MQCLGPAAAAQRGVEQRGELHRDRAGAATMSPRDALKAGRDDGAPVDAAVREEAPVLGGEHRAPERRRDLVERRPGEPPAPRIGAHLLDHLAVAIEQQQIGGAIGRAHVGEGGRGRHDAAQDQPEPEARPAEGERDADEHQRARPRHGATSSGAFGSSPNISGAYSASTRVAGSSKRPPWFRRTVYSTVKLPFGT